MLMADVINNEKLETLNSQFYSVLGDFKKYYIFSNKNPEYQEYANAYSQAKSTIQNINSQLFKISSETEAELNKLIDESKDINSKIDEEKAAQIKLKSNLNSIESNINGANVMIDNYKEIYKEQYIRNVSTFLGLFLSSFIIYKVYHKK